MIPLSHFNQLTPDEALTVLQPCVAISSWSVALARGRPYADLAALMNAARECADSWGEAELEQALSAHPRIGEKPAGQQAHVALSRHEQEAVNGDDGLLARSLQEGNARYEARFGRIFLIRARGRSGQTILRILEQRLQNSKEEEVEAALTQLREITLLRLEGVVGECIP